MTDFTCGCGRPATTEIQTGWDPAANNGAGGGSYEPLCDSCYALTEEAEHRREVFALVVQDVYNGLYTRTVLHGHGRWVGPRGRFHDDAEHLRLSTDPYGVYHGC